MKVLKSILFEGLNISYFCRLNCKIIVGKYLMPLKEEKDKKYLLP